MIGDCFMSELVEVAKAISAPATKLIEVVSRGIGRAYDPRYKRKMADAAAYEIDTIAGAIRRNGDVPTLFDREGIQLDARSTQDLIERTGMRLFSQEVRKQQNIESIVDKAYEELKNEESVSNEPVDDDWIVRFFNSVEDVSNEKLQEIWGRILAGEIREPKQYPMRTLDVLRNITTKEANILEEISFCILRTSTTAFIPRVEQLWNEFNIQFNAVCLLGEAGIINLYPHNLIIDINKEPQAIIFNNQIVGSIKRKYDQQSDKVYLNMESLTEAGKQLIDIIYTNQVKSGVFALKYFQYLKDTLKNCEVKAFKVMCESENDIKCGTEDLLD